MSDKTLGNTTASKAKDNVRDIKFWGDGDNFRLLSKAWSDEEGWMKSTKAMEIEGHGCVVQVTTQQKSADGTYAVAEAVTYVPDVHIVDLVDEEDAVVGRRLEANVYNEEENEG